MPGRSIWSGTVSFGLVAIPVAVVPAVRDSRPRLNMLHEQDKARLRRVMRCPVDDELVRPDEVVRGFELEPGRHVVVTDEELRGMAPEKSSTIEIEDFVDLDAIDTIYFDRPYYLVPSGKGADKPYRLLVEALGTTRKAGVARFVMRGNEHLVAVRAMDGALGVVTLHYHDEVDSAEELRPEARAAAGAVRSMKASLERLAGPFEPDRYEDPYREQLVALIETHRKANDVVEAPEPEEEELDDEEEQVDLVAALERSLARASPR